MKEPIEMNQIGAVLGEGAAVRLSGATTQTAGGETHVYFEPCDENKAIAISDACDNETGMCRTLDVNMTLRNVCPGKRVAVGMALYEVDAEGNEYSRGFRAVTVPAHDGCGCRDLPVTGVRDVLPADLRVDRNTGCGCGCGRRGRRHFILRTSNHYVDGIATF